MITITPDYLAAQGFSPTIVERFWSKVRKTKTCWLWTGSLTTNGYGQINTGIKDKPARAHVVSWIINHGPIPDGLCVLHNCPGKHMKKCVNPNHLKIGNHSQNGFDAVKQGTILGQRGEAHHSAKLTEAQVRDILRRYSAGDHRITALGEEFGVSKHQVYMIVSRRKWQSLSP